MTLCKNKSFALTFTPEVVKRSPLTFTQVHCSGGKKGQSFRETLTKLRAKYTLYTLSGLLSNRSSNMYFKLEGKFVLLNEPFMPQKIIGFNTYRLNLHAHETIHRKRNCLLSTTFQISKVFGCCQF